MATRNTDGLRYPSIDDLLEVVDSKYKLAYISAKRANRSCSTGSFESREAR